MLIQIKQDAHDIVQRLREIDTYYCVVYNTLRECFEVHNSMQKNTYCLTIPYTQLDCRSITLTLKTRREFLNRILAEIDENNERLDRECKRKIMDMSEWKLKEMYDFAQRYDKEEFNDAYITKWA